MNRLFTIRRHSLTLPLTLRHPAKPLLVALFVFITPQSVQAAGPVVPGAGTLIQEVRPVEILAPTPAIPGLIVEPQGEAKLPPSIPFTLNTIKISGNTVFDTPILQALVKDAVGKTMTLSELASVTARITDYYRRHGYLLARAIVPAQTIQDGLVNIKVIEAHYGTILFDNRSKVNAALLKATLSPLQSEQAIEQAKLDKVLLLLSDIPGVVAEATLKPGESMGMSDLEVNMIPEGVFVTGNVTLDNYGSRYTGRNRLGATVNLIEPLKHGDILSLGGLSSGSGMKYGHLSYEALLIGQGTRMGGSYSALNYELNENNLASLDAHGEAQVASLWMKHPLMRGRNVNLYGQIQYDQKSLRDRIDTVLQQTDRNLGGWTAALSGDMRDAFLSTGAVNVWYAGWTFGRVGFKDTTAELNDSSSANTQGSFSKYNVSYSRLQNLSRKSALYFSYSGQWASANLDSSEKFILGGPYTVRAYETGAVSGDAGQLLTGEFRYDMGQAGHGQLQTVAFVDSGRVTINKNTWVAGENSATLSGYGVGMNWKGDSESDASQWMVKANIAARIGSASVLVANDATTRVWIVIGKGF